MTYTLNRSRMAFPSVHPTCTPNTGEIQNGNWTNTLLYPKSHSIITEHWLQSSSTDILGFSCERLLLAPLLTNPSLHYTISRSGLTQNPPMPNPPPNIQEISTKHSESPLILTLDNRKRWNDSCITWTVNDTDWSSLPEARPITTS